MNKIATITAANGGMSLSPEQTAIALRGVCKTYKLYDRPADELVDLLGLRRILPWRGRARAFEALKSVDATLERGSKVGIIGRNGAGKSTLLKLITGSIEPTAGELVVNGRVQALIEIGLGFHQDFSGRENIRASLGYNGLESSEIDSASEEVVEFCQLGKFLDQPLKTYSLGMRSRLYFACATALNPDILVIDEVMGAGDAYFAQRSADRMRSLTSGGCTLLLVSHSMAQVVQFCDRVIWLEDGRIILDGDAVPVVKAYEEFIQRLQHERPPDMMGDPIEEANDWFRDQVLQRVLSGGMPLAVAAMAEDADAADGAKSDGGDEDARSEPDSGQGDSTPQDVSAPQGGEAEATAKPLPEPAGPNGQGKTPDGEGDAGQAYGPGLLPDSVPATPEQLLAWETRYKQVNIGRAVPPSYLTQPFEVAEQDPTLVMPDGVSRWPASRGLKIHRIWFSDGTRDKAVFEVGDRFHLYLQFMAEEAGSYECRYTVVIFMTHGHWATRFHSDVDAFTLSVGEYRVARLTLDPILLGRGEYIVSVALFDSTPVERIQEARRYDLISRSFLFQTVNRIADDDSLFLHPHSWQFQRSNAAFET